DITRGEIELTNRVDSEYEQAMADFDADFISRKATSSPDDLLRRISTNLVADPHQLSKIYTRTSHVPSERERLAELLPRTLYELKYEHLNVELDSIIEEIAEAQKRGDIDAVMSLLRRQIERKSLQGEFARYLGERNLCPDKLPSGQ
ncbi:MAG: hypothetical protein K2I56_04440, partial [Muribaculaceae bacterium]|nr:hypothetical protein [Muribaculaceae bacterium]